MLKRLGFGLIKGVLIGAGVGAGIQLGLGWTETSGLLGYLLAMGVGATAGILAGKPPWRQEAWIEALLKAAGGVGVGALLYWLGTSFAGFDVPFAVGGAEAGIPWTSIPLLYAPAISGLFGTLVELDNTDDPKPTGKEKKAAPSPAGKQAVRIEATDEIEEAVVVSESRKKSPRA
jgi:hypothetical protein